MDLPAPLRIALCDDTPALLEREQALLEAELADLPYRMACCTDAGELLRAAAEQPFDVAVLDIQMPSRDGIAVGRELLQDGPAALALLLALGNVSFALYDRALAVLTRCYRTVWRKKLKFFH